MGTTQVLFNNEKLTVTAVLEAGNLLITLAGIIDEDVRFDTLLATTNKNPGPATRLTFDLGKVNRINSTGVREWLILMENIRKTHSELCFQNVAESFLDQANMVSDMFGKGTAQIVSFFAPYFCSQCDQTFSILLKPNEILGKDGHYAAPKSVCEKPECPREFDWIPEECFHFLKRPNIKK